MLSKSFSPGLAAISAVTIWGASFPAASVALESFSPGALACVRFVLSSIIIGVIVFLKRESLPPLHLAVQVALVGFLGVGFTQICISYGLTFATSGDAAFIVSTSPIFVILISYMLGNSRPTWNSVVGVFIGATGLLLILLQSGIEIDMIGLLSITMASVALAAYTVLNPSYLSEKAEVQLSSLQFLAVSMWSSTVVFSLFWGQEAVEQLPTATDVALLSTVFLAVFSGVASYWLFSYALTYQHPVATSGAIYLEPPIAILTAFLWLQEVPSMTAIAGGLIILFGVWFANQTVVPSWLDKGRRMLIVSGDVK